MTLKNDKKDRELDFLEKAMRHDLNNKASIIEGYTELGEENGEAVKQAKKELEQIYSEIRDGEDEISFQDMMSCSYQTLTPRIQDENKEIVIDYHKNDEVYFNDTRKNIFHPAIERMMYNLLDNSLEHGNNDTIEMEIDPVGEDITVEVYDGGGLDRETINTLFPETTDYEEHVSTGSYIINQIAQEYNVKIDSPKSKNCYEITLPKNHQ